LTVVSPADPDGPELVLEPDRHPAVKPFKEALVKDGIPFTSFVVDDVKTDFDASVTWVCGSLRSRWTPGRSRSPSSTTPGQSHPDPQPELVASSDLGT
jgi:hypothetical protein